MAPTNDIAHASHADAEFDALADLFLGDRGAPRRSANGHAKPATEPATPFAFPAAPAPSPDSTQSPGIDLIVQGHLPVRAGPWIARYAGERAARLGHAIALVRLSQGHVTVDVIAPRATEASSASGVPSIEAALAAAAGAATETILAVDAVEELDILSREGIATITVLTGANEAAVVEAYRALKVIGAKVVERADGGEGIDIRIGVMGSDSARATQAWRKLADASRAFIGRELELAAIAEKIEPSPAMNYFRGDTDLAPSAIVELIRTAAAAPAAPTPAPPVAHPVTRPVRPAEAPKPQRPATDADGPDVLALIGGLTPVALPSAPDAQVRAGRDAQGGLHLVRRDTDSAEFAVAALIAVDAWIIANRALIEMAHAAPIVGEPALHLVTESASRARPLLGSRIRVHALVRATGPFAAIALN